MAKILLKQGWYEKAPKSNNIDLKRIHERMIENIPKIDKTSVNNLSKILNQIVTDNSYNENEFNQKIFSKIPQLLSETIDNNVEEVVKKYNVSSGFQVDYNPEYHKTAQQAWKNYSILAKQYKSNPTEINALEMKAAKSEALSLQGKLNTLKGQLFEGFLQAAILSIPQDATNLTNDKLNELLSNFISNQSIINTKGTDRYSTSIVVDEKEIKYMSQGKVDVVGPSPFKNADEMFISAKNYSSLRNIQLVSGANIFGLMDKWDTNEDTVAYACQILSKKGAYNTTGYNLIKKIFAIQALVGSNNKDISNILVINIKSRKKNPIVVLSTSNLINQIYNEQNNKKAFIFSPDPLNKGQSDTESAFNYLNNIKLSVKLNSEMLKQKYLQNLTRG